MTESWRRTAEDAGLDVQIVSRVSEAVAVDTVVAKRLPAVPGAMDAHLRLVRTARRVVRSARPSVLYLQNYFLPFAEVGLVRAAQRAGSRVVLAVHNHRPHQLRSGSALGLRKLVESVDEVVTHSEFVRTGLRDAYGRDSTVVPHPTQSGILAATAVPLAGISERLDGRRIAVRFGVLARGYKGGDALDGLVELVGDQWLVIAGGVGAGGVRGAELTVDRFLSEGELRWLIEHADASLLPYRSATQSGAVVLAQILGAPPIASDVGGIGEQICDGRDGVLVRPGAAVEEWGQQLVRIAAQPFWWRDVAMDARKRARSADLVAREEWLDLVATGGIRR